MDYTTIIILLFALVFIIMAVKAWNHSVYYDEETETTITTEEKPNVVGALPRKVDGSQFYVIDPVDRQKVWLNSNDDLYEDANGKVWRLV